MKRVLLGLFGISAWVTGFPDLGREVQPKFKASVRPALQRQTDRAWNPWSWRKVGSIGPAQGLGGPVYMHIGSGDGLVVFDAPNYAIRRIASSGRISDSIRITPAVLRESSGPFTDVAPQEDGMLWVCNPNQSVVGFLGNGRVQRTVRAMRLGVLKDRLIVTLVNSDQLFAIYTTAGQVAGRFGEFLSNSARRHYWSTVGLQSMQHSNRFSLPPDTPAFWHPTTWTEHRDFLFRPSMLLHYQSSRSNPTER